MEEQGFLFEEFSQPKQPPPAAGASRAAQNNTAKQRVHSLKIVASDASKKLGKDQKIFNRLVAKVERLRRDIADRTARLDKALAQYSTKLHPLQKREADARKPLVRLFFHFWKNPAKPPLGKRQRAALREMIVSQLDAIGNFYGDITDTDLRAIFAELESESIEEMRERMVKEKNAELRDDIQDMFDETGIDMDVSDFDEDMTDEERQRFIDELRQQAAEADGRRAEESARPRKKTKRELQREAREQAIEEARKRNIGAIYKQLARVLHPDLEADPAKRAHKEELMKELTVAHKAGDLHTLLRLEMEWIHREEGDLERLSGEKLRIYNDVLREQVTGLEQELNELAFHPRYEPLQQFGGLFEVLYGFNTGREKARIESIIASIEKSARNLEAGGKVALDEVRHTIKARLDYLRRTERQHIPAFDDIIGMAMREALADMDDDFDDEDDFDD